MQEEIRDRVTELEQRTRDRLRVTLERELYPNGSKEVPTNLKNAFLVDCFDRIAPEEQPVERAKQAEGYDATWGDRQKKTLATGLNYLLTERVGRDRSPIKGQTNELLAELIVAIRLADEDQYLELSQPTTEPPRRTEPPASRFTDGLPLDDVTQSAVAEWVNARRPEDTGQHAVYVLDCTQPLGDEEYHLAKRFRARVAEKVKAGEPLSKQEEVGKAANNDERLYYVGYASDVANRILRHLGGVDQGSAQITHTFPPQRLVEVTWYDSEAKARLHERKRADQLTVDGTSHGYYN